MSEMLWLLPLLWAGSLAQHAGYTLTVQTPVTVQEGLCVSVSCTFTALWTSGTSIPAYGSWFPDRANVHHDAAVVTSNQSRNVQEETQGRFHLLGDPRTNNCSLDIRDARRTDEGLYFFRVERAGYQEFKYSYIQDMLSVQVTALNHTPHILNPGPLESGHSRNLTCSVPWACERGTPPIFSWTSAAHTALGPRTHLSSVLTLTPRPQDHGTNLTCQVHFPAAGVTVETTIQLNVSCVTENPTPGGCLGDSAGEPRTRADMVRAAVGGAGVTALLAGCLCLIYFVVKTRRKNARTAMGMGNIHTATGPASLGHQKTPELESPPADSTSSAGAAPTLRVEPEVYYASIRFQGKNSPQTNTEPEYSNVRTQ
ncbi:myeloid cell surface antigen CD33-like [Myotis daubentonii]|uniref:myeloid cell surface antigen CD33-like n=1 Tax=Myotis daubentonii TaxID=98922 RepID=UPI0028739FD9|nr:myeloid cell surface antigen CD33-like [Myotis daubentonii]